jgi:hypothetical protein
LPEPGSLNPSPRRCWRPSDDERGGLQRSFSRKARAGPRGRTERFRQSRLSANELSPCSAARVRDLPQRMYYHKTVMQSWVEQPNRSCSRRGAPDRTAPLADGGRVDTWVSTWSNDRVMQTCRKTFTANPEGTVTQWTYTDCGGDPPIEILLSK